MFVTISWYHAKTGEEDAILALHEDWQRHQRPKLQGFLSGELLRSVDALHEFITILHFESQEAAQRIENDPDYDAWYQRLVSLTEVRLTRASCTSEWQAS